MDKVYYKIDNGVKFQNKRTIKKLQRNKKG